MKKIYLCYIETVEGRLEKKLKVANSIIPIKKEIGSALIKYDNVTDKLITDELKESIVTTIESISKDEVETQAIIDYFEL